MYGNALLKGTMIPGSTYSHFLQRLKSFERIEPAVLPRGPEKLVSMRLLMEALGHPERDFQVIHGAGTNGKGLTSAMIAALLRLEGYAVGLYTSPHVLDIRERIVVNGEWVAPQVFAQAGGRVLDLAEPIRAQHTVSYFDLLTATALEVFRMEGARWVVLETGLGGRADATNAVDKACAVLTRIGLDHQSVLGNTLREIAWEKLGIARPGIPTVLAGQPPELLEWLTESLRNLGSPVVRAEAYRLAVEAGTAIPGVRVEWADGNAFTIELPAQTPPLTPPRLTCAANALAAAETVLGAATLSRREAWVRTVLAVQLPARLELRRGVGLRGSSGPRLAQVVLDGGHNGDALEALADQLARWEISRYTLLLSLQADKLVAAVRSPLARLVAGAERILFLPPNTPRAPSPESFRQFLAELMPKAGQQPQPEMMNTPEEALRAALETPARPFVACGSFWMLGDLMPLLESGVEEQPDEVKG